MKPLALCGFMGTCKSTAGRLAADMLGYEFIDTDEMVEQEQDCTINIIFERQGEAGFRALEEKAVAQALLCENAVISLGGGAVLTAGVRDMLQRQAITVLLTATPEAIAQRLQGDTTRPNLRTPDIQSIAALMEKRREVYQQCADAVVDTTDRAPEEIAADIAKAYRRLRNG